MFLKNKIINFKIRRSKVTDYVALIWNISVMKIGEMSSVTLNITLALLTKTHSSNDNIITCLRASSNSF